MISQTAPEGEPHFVLTMADHTDMCGQMARAFGNERFEPSAPFDEVVYIVENHDRGWDGYDSNPGIDPITRVPYIMARTPIPDAVKTNRGSPDFNEVHHPYCGLLSSMHSWGLYNGRFGFSKFVPRTQTTTSISVPDAHRPLIDAMLAYEEARQVRLKTALAADPATRDWVEEQHLFQNYKQLQFFDTMSLYFHLRHAGERGTETYVHVPLNSRADTIITLQKVDERVYSLDPFPFAGDRLTIVCRGRYVMPFPDDFPPDRVGAALRELPEDRQTYQLVPA
ncbi:MAG TPA: DUF3891 family protein [Xanthobacteraceae bacterium]|nr:DUF3891 family protein [Xanthobacteraceae bacterium]